MTSATGEKGKQWWDCHPEQVCKSALQIILQASCQFSVQVLVRFNDWRCNKSNINIVMIKFHVFAFHECGATA